MLIKQTNATIAIALHLHHEHEIPHKMPMPMTMTMTAFAKGYVLARVLPKTVSTLIGVYSATFVGVFCGVLLLLLFLLLLLLRVGSCIHKKSVLAAQSDGKNADDTSEEPVTSCDTNPNITSDTSDSLLEPV